LSFRVLLHPKAARALKKLPAPVRSRIVGSLEELKQRPESGERLSPSQFWKLRVGDYRVVYEIDRREEQVIVLLVRHRKNVYDEFSRLL